MLAQLYQKKRFLEKIKSNPIKIGDGTQAQQKASGDDILASLKSLNKAMELKDEAVNNSTVSSANTDKIKGGKSDNDNALLAEQKGWIIHSISTILLLVLGTYLAFFIS